MKPLFFIAASFVLLTAFTMGKTAADFSKAAADMGTAAPDTRKVTDSYLLLKDCFIVSDSMNASKYAQTLREELEKVNFGGKKAKPTDSLVIVQKESIELAAAIAATHNVNKQRKAFAPLSEKMWFLLKDQRKPAATLYRQQCPMTGVTWISSDSTIKNPYYPKNMLTCGEVLQVIGNK